MCIGGSSSPPPSPAAPPPPPSPTPVTAKRIQPRKKTKPTREGPKRRIGAARQGMLIKKTGVQYVSSGSGVNL